MKIFFSLINILILLSPSLYALTPEQQKLSLLAESLSLVSKKVISDTAIKTPSSVTSIKYQAVPTFKNFPTFNEWAAECDLLPYYRNFVKPNYCNKGIDWKAFETALLEFFNIMQKHYLQPDLWLENPPKENDDFIQIPDEYKKFFKPFVQKLIVNTGDIVAFRGDLHGDVKSLIAYIKYLQKAGYLDNDDSFKIAKEYRNNFYMVFLGDYVDRGIYGFEVIYTLMRLKIANPNHVFLVRGNHEDIEISSLYDFNVEVEAKVNPSEEAAPFPKICRLYDFLPVALYLGCENNFIQCCHGGMEIGYKAQNLIDNSNKTCYQFITKLDKYDNYVKHINRAITYYKRDRWGQRQEETITLDKISTFGEITNMSIDAKNPNFSLIGFMWNDFSVNNVNDNDNVEYYDERGFQYGKWATNAILNMSSTEKNKVLGVFRAHQHSPGDDMWQSIMTGNGLSKLWQNSTSTTTNLWPGIVCTFLVGPDTPYGKNGNYNYDAFGILKTAPLFTDWQLELHKNKFNFS